MSCPRRTGSRPASPSLPDPLDDREGWDGSGSPGGGHPGDGGRHRGLRTETGAAQFDRVLAAFETGTAAKLAVARGDPNAVDPQLAFEEAGGLDAWFAMIDAMRAAGGGAATDPPCANTGISP